MSDAVKEQYVSLAKNILNLTPEELVKRYKVSENKAKRIKREFTLLLQIEKEIVSSKK